MNVATEKGVSALHLAAGKGHSEAVTALLDAGADVLQCSDNEVTALHVASQVLSCLLSVARSVARRQRAHWSDAVVVGNRPLGRCVW